LKTKLLTGFIIIAILIPLTACSSDGLVGRWVNDEVTIDFMADGEYIFVGENTQTGTWRSPADGEIVVSTVSVLGTVSMSGTYSISGNQLTLVFENGDEYALMRA